MTATISFTVWLLALAGLASLILFDVLRTLPL
jgi:hypothetical protein